MKPDGSFYSDEEMEAGGAFGTNTMPNEKKTLKLSGNHVTVPLRQTHTYAILEIGEEAYNEIAQKLREAGYDHVFNDEGVIDMHGIGLCAPQPLPTTSNKVELCTEKKPHLLYYENAIDSFIFVPKKAKDHILPLLGLDKLEEMDAGEKYALELKRVDMSEAEIAALPKD